MTNDNNVDAACYAYQMKLSLLLPLAVSLPRSLLPPPLSVGPQGNPRVLAEPLNSSISIHTR